MSRKSSRGPKPATYNLQEAPAPREMAVLEVENQKLCAQAGTLQYQIYVLEHDLIKTNEALRDLNYEAAARQKLDAKQAATKDGE